MNTCTSKNRQRVSKNDDFRDGTTFVKDEQMKWNFTYKELSLLLGILVAAIIVLTLWLQPLSSKSGNISKKPTPALSLPSSKTILKKVVLATQELLR